MVKKNFLYGLMSFFALTNFSYGSIVSVKNKTSETLKLRIEPQSDKSAAFSQEISSSPESSFIITYKQTKGSSFFSVKNVKATFDSSSNCENLETEKDYQLTFEKSKGKVSCVASEVSKK